MSIDIIDRSEARRLGIVGPLGQTEEAEQDLPSVESDHVQRDPGPPLPPMPTPTLAEEKERGRDLDTMEWIRAEKEKQHAAEMEPIDVERGERLLISRLAKHAAESEPEPEPEPDPDDDEVAKAIDATYEGLTPEQAKYRAAHVLSEGGAFGEMTEDEPSNELSYWPLDEDDHVQFDRVPRRLERSPMWQHLTSGGRVFVAFKKPMALAYLYAAATRRAKKWGTPWRLRMRQGTYEGIHGSVMWLDRSQDQDEA